MQILEMVPKTLKTQRMQILRFHKHPRNKTERKTMRMQKIKSLKEVSSLKNQR